MSLMLPKLVKRPQAPASRYCSLLQSSAVRSRARFDRSLGASFALAALLTGCSGEIASPLSPFAASSASSPTAPGAPSSPAGDTAGSGGPSIGVTTAPLDCSQVRVGATPLQRLGRTQYANAVRDLLKINFDENILPEDERFGVFDGNTVVPVTDLLVQQYMSAAESAAQQAAATIENVVSCDRPKLGDAACAAQFVDKFGLRVFRRPLTTEEKSAYVGLFNEYKGVGYAGALRVVVQTMLQSPNFIYRVELQPVAPAGGEALTLDAYELASRISFFLLSTTPDDELLASAASGALMTDAGLDGQVDRLIEDERFADTLASFHLQWLDIRHIESVTKDATLYPAYNADLAKAMIKETLTFVNYVMREDDGKLDTLLTAPYSFPEGPLLGVYGLPSSAAAKSGTPVPLDPMQRSGLLTQPAFLASHAHYNQTSPVGRGKVIIRNVFCANLPDPPPNVNTTPPDPSPTATTRMRLTEHQDNASCAGCHKKIDGIGLGFEQFDAIGGFRAMEGDKPVDATGEITGTKTSDAKFNGAVDLSQKLADSAEVQQCVTKQWLRFAIGRLESDADACTLQKLFKDFAASGNDIRALLQAIVRSDTFRSKRVRPVSAP